MYFWNYRLRKTWLDKCVKSPLSDDPSKDNMANGSKHCCNLNDSALTIFSNQCEGNYVAKVSFSDIQNPKTFC